MSITMITNKHHQSKRLEHSCCPVFLLHKVHRLTPVYPVNNIYGQVPPGERDTILPILYCRRMHTQRTAYCHDVPIVQSRDSLVKFLKESLLGGIVKWNISNIEWAATLSSKDSHDIIIVYGETYYHSTQTSVR